MKDMTEPSAERAAGDTTVGILQGSRSTVLAQIGQRGVGATIWQRRLPQALSGWLGELSVDRLPSLREKVRVGEIAGCLRAACAEAGTPDDPMRDVLIEDITRLGGLFSDMMGAPRLRLRLDAIQGDACTRFHVDTLRARMLCTYRGPGTQFALGAPGSDPEVPVTDAGTGSVVLMRGKLWPGHEMPGVLHRSPPISGTGQTRLVLVFDPVEDTELVWH
ncbi:DUF1826 domain-containing protein [Celeribacter sp. SCSIO 80788]|uniref:DUF1826 domain-containing protein n=1 Tax=Celeribacter sp. SCSIO 80788 TaxID=3117013 RepID=UPI003DA52018